MLCTVAIISLGNFSHHSKLAETAQLFSVAMMVKETNVSPVSCQTFMPEESQT